MNGQTRFAPTMIRKPASAPGKEKFACPLFISLLC